jgi:hypothetical protein
MLYATAAGMSLVFVHHGLVQIFGLFSVHIRTFTVDAIYVLNMEMTGSSRILLFTHKTALDLNPEDHIGKTGKTVHFIFGHVIGMYDLKFLQR